MLALELVAADTRGGADQTFIFDEVDAGVGGKAAVELGNVWHGYSQRAGHRRHPLGAGRPWADAQFVSLGEPPDADDDDLGVVTTIAEVVNGETRVHEIARACFRQRIRKPH